MHILSFPWEAALQKNLRTDNFLVSTMYLFFLKTKNNDRICDAFDVQKRQVMADVILILDNGNWQSVFLKFPTYLYTRHMYMTIHKVILSLENTIPILWTSLD